MSNYFQNIERIVFEGKTSRNPLAFKYYDPKKIILGKTMEEHLRFSVCYWHSFCWNGQDIFGAPTFNRPWLAGENSINSAKQKCDVAFEFFEKLGAPYFCFHDFDLAPEGATFKESAHNLDLMTDYAHEHMARTGVKLLWGTANLFSHPRYCAGAATNPDPAVFAYACAQVKQVLEKTHALGGENYVMWGGREGYETLLNTDLKKEAEQFSRFLNMVVEHKYKIGFKGTLLIEPKPQEPSKHQYDYDVATVHGFLTEHGLEKEIKVNIEANHATLSGHSFHHEVATAFAKGIFGSIDANRGDAQNGWDTDQFPNDVQELTLVMHELLKHGGFETGGFNFDTKLRRQSIDPQDLFFGHIGAMDVMARALENAEKLFQDAVFKTAVDERYSAWSNELGTEILKGGHSLASLHAWVLSENVNPKPKSGRQEALENILNLYL